MEISELRYRELLERVGIRAIRQGGRGSLRLVDRTARQQALSTATRNETKRIEDQPADLPKGTSVPHEVKEILLVDPDLGRLLAAKNALRLVADVSACSDFRAARARLLAKPPDLLITNLQLEAYNGLHLVHLTEGTATRCIAYGTYNDPCLAREVQTAGAFYEHSLRLPGALTSYVHAVLPPHDRRDPTLLDRRQSVRGGRRCNDLRRSMDFVQRTRSIQSV